MIALLLLLPLFVLAIQTERGGPWKVFVIFMPPAMLLDVFLNFTELALLTLDFPRSGEWTFSVRLRRLVLRDDWRGSVARYLATILNSIDPTGKHV